MSLFENSVKDVFIVAEIGNNHNADIEAAKQLIDAASDARVDAVKFQTFRGIDIVSPTIPTSEYPEWDVTGYGLWHEFLDSVALPLEKHKEVFDYANRKGIISFSTVTSPELVDFLEEMDVKLYKIASMDIDNIPLLEKVAETKKTVILSTGMALEKEIENAVGYFDREKLAVLHCVSDYPLEYPEANLRSITWLKNRFGCVVGFSDHSLGYDLGIAAVSLGARIIEKHITLDRNSTQKAEHHFALEPDELKIFVKKIREIEIALGEEKITISEKEKNLKKRARRSLHVKRQLKSGHTLTPEDIAIVRPSSGAAPKDYRFFLNKKLARDKSPWTPLRKEDLSLS